MGDDRPLPVGSVQERHRVMGWHDPFTPTPVSDEVRQLIIGLVQHDYTVSRWIVRRLLRQIEGIEVTVDQVRTVFAEIDYTDCRYHCEDV